MHIKAKIHYAISTYISCISYIYPHIHSCKHTFTLAFILDILDNVWIMSALSKHIEDTSINALHYINKSGGE
ncbi:hypothetical protein CQA63_08975 [Helicobacter marmotae]|uniref:Uncharacterized protein n=1 Tax=Helicobacter marmotae TaxID=152490 RepID=A0A3D8I156_9HELI|nr:hypothetical protein CQA63_08975 [Helicobacter marmotae]